MTSRTASSTAGESRTDGPAADPQASASETYGFVCGTALIVIGLILIRRGMFPLALFPVGAGFLGLFFRWRIAPVLVIGITGSCLIRAEDGTWQTATLPPEPIVEIQTWILCSPLGDVRAGTLSIAIADREQSFPATGAARASPSAQEPCSSVRVLGSTVGTGEVATCWCCVLPFVTFAALLLLRVLPPSHRRQSSSIRTGWPTLVLIWILALSATLLHAVLSYVGLRNLTVAAARTLLAGPSWLEIAPRPATHPAVATLVATQKGR